jgi:hypothetical protein
MLKFPGFKRPICHFALIQYLQDPVKLFFLRLFFTIRIPVLQKLDKLILVINGDAFNGSICIHGKLFDGAFEYLVHP